MLNPKKITDAIKELLKPLAPYFDDRNVTEIMVNPGGHLYVESKGFIEYKGQLLTENSIAMALIAMGKLVRRDASPNDETAIVDATIDDMRVAGALHPVSPAGSFFSIRKHQDPQDRPTLADLIQMEALTQQQADTIRRLVIEERKNCVIAGGTSSGKTTLTNGVLSLIPPHERIAVIEDSAELQIKIDNKIGLLTNPTNKIDARRLVKLAMRIRPDRLILGETRGDETFDVIRGFNSGHDGSITTVHASSPESALDALEMLFQMSLPPGASIPSEMVRRYIAKSVHVLVFAGRSTKLVEGKQKVVRRVEHIYLVKGVKDGAYQLEEA